MDANRDFEINVLEGEVVRVASPSDLRSRLGLPVLVPDYWPAALGEPKYFLQFFYPRATPEIPSRFRAVISYVVSSAATGSITDSREESHLHIEGTAHEEGRLGPVYAEVIAGAPFPTRTLTRGSHVEAYMEGPGVDVFIRAQGVPRTELLSVIESFAIIEADS